MNRYHTNKSGSIYTKEEVAALRIIAHGTLSSPITHAPRRSSRDVLILRHQFITHCQLFLSLHHYLTLLPYHRFSRSQRPFYRQNTRRNVTGYGHVHIREPTETECADKYTHTHEHTLHSPTPPTSLHVQAAPCAILNPLVYDTRRFRTWWIEGNRRNRTQGPRNVKKERILTGLRGDFRKILTVGLCGNSPTLLLPPPSPIFAPSQPLLLLSPPHPLLLAPPLPLRSLPIPPPPPPLPTCLPQIPQLL